MSSHEITVPNVDVNTLIISDIPDYNIQEYDIFNEKDFKKYVSDIERIVRTSFEYREFINYLRTYMDMNKCSFYENVNNIDTFKIKIHIHHCPFTLYDIVLTIFNKRMFYQEPMDVELVAKEVMYIHYYLMVGLIPLAETVHELVHNQVLFIPLDKVMGNYEEFISTYKEWIPEEIMDKFHYYEQQTQIYNEAANLEILREKPLLVEIPESEVTLKLPNMERILELMENRIIELKEQQTKSIAISPISYDNNIDEDSLICPIYYD